MPFAQEVQVELGKVISDHATVYDLTGKSAHMNPLARPIGSVSIWPASRPDHTCLNSKQLRAVKRSGSQRNSCLTFGKNYTFTCMYRVLAYLPVATQGRFYRTPC